MHFEDFQVGESRDYGSHTLTREEIVGFAERFDPQPFHLDEEAAKRSPYGGIIASGWHTTAVCMRLTVDMMQAEGESGSLGSPGVDEIRWLAPVYAGDTLSVRSEVVEVKPSRSKPDRGLVRVRYQVRNQHGADVMTMIGLGIFRRRASP